MHDHARVARCLRESVIVKAMSMRRVIKLGGSLLESESIAERFANWLALQPPAQNITIVGGGEIIDAMRRLDQRFSLDQAWTHWHCVDLLRTTHGVLASELADWTPIGSRTGFAALRSGQRHSGGSRTGAVWRGRRCGIIAITRSPLLSIELPLHGKRNA